MADVTVRGTPRGMLLARDVVRSVAWNVVWNMAWSVERCVERVGRRAALHGVGLRCVAICCVVCVGDRPSGAREALFWHLCSICSVRGGRSSFYYPNFRVGYRQGRSVKGSNRGQAFTILILVQGAVKGCQSRLQPAVSCS